MNTRTSVERLRLVRSMLAAVRTCGPGLACSTAAVGQTAVFQDGEFSDLEWTLTTLTTASTSPWVTGTQQASGGSPGAFRKVVLTVPGGAYSHVLSFHSRVGDVVDPSLTNGIRTIDFAIDYRCFESCAPATGCRQTGVALRQSGEVFVVPGCQATTSTTQWTQCSGAGLTATDFQWVDEDSTNPMVILNASIHPDFSCGAPPVEFGFFVWGAGGHAGSGACETTSGYDNWLVTVHTGSPNSYCTPGLSSSGCTSTTSSVGSPSASAASGFTVQVAGVDGQRQGLVFYGVSGPTSSPWGSQSYLCVKAPTQRTGVQSSGGSAGACDGSLALDWNAWRAAHPSALGQPFSAGDSIWLQGWFRDPGSVKTTTLSDALAATLCP